MKIFRNTALAIALTAAAFSVKAEGWPADYQGVMLQGFYWDSYADTNWANLESKVDEYSKYFSLIWVPNSGKAEGQPTMGYHPVYWFTNHNSSFGSEAQLRSMIKAYKEHGTGIIADVVINHRSGVSNWTNFPVETWNGKTYQIGPEGICNGDEVKNASGQAKPTGASDTGENWDGARDLDHTNANVQTNCKDYIKCLLTDFGYAGVRYDFVKGYSSKYTKMYNQANNVKYSVGEYWDGSYDAVKAWIDGTGKESAAFDFPFKYQINKAFSSNNMGELVWKAYGTTDQPAGMVHADYQQYAVTFIDNHDTYRDGSRFTGDVLAANAFMLCSPGTPCVFLPHYKQYPGQIQTMINVRNSAGVSNTSKVTVEKVDRNVYLAVIDGSKGRVGVRIGSGVDVPSGFSSENLKLSGDKFAIWSNTGVKPGSGSEGSSYPNKLYIQGDINGSHWTTSNLLSVEGNNGVYVFPNVKVEKSADKADGFFSFTDGEGANWDALNSVSNRYGAMSKDARIVEGGSAQIRAFMMGVDASACNSWAIVPGNYDLVVDLSRMTLKVTKGGSSDVERIDTDSIDRIRYYNLQGVEVSSPEHGIYIVVRGSHVTKEYVM